MKNWTRWCSLTVAATTMGLLSCSPKNVQARLERNEAQAEAIRPVSTEVELVRIPANPNLPTWVVTIEPFIMGASGVTSGIGAPGGEKVINPGEQIGPGISAQLISSLRQVGNVVVVDYSSYDRSPEKIMASLKPNERGPFIIKGAITEFSEIADASGKGESTGPNVPSMFIPYVGPIVSYGIGTKSKSESRRTGMVALDVQIVDPVSGRLMASFIAEGEFTSLCATASRTTWGNTKTSKECASSAIGQAQRIALNKTIVQIHSALTSQ